MNALSFITPRFGWNNSDKKPTKFHVVADESNLSDIFEDPRELDGKWGARNADVFIQPSETLVDQALACFSQPDNPETSRVFVLDIPNTLGMTEQSARNFFDNLLTALFGRLKTLPRHATMPLASEKRYQHRWANMGGVDTAQNLNGLSSWSTGPAPLDEFRNQHHAVSSLHWDTTERSPSPEDVDALPYLALIYGKRENMTPDSGLSLFCDFQQWYLDQGFEKPLAELTHAEVATMLLDYSQQMEAEYTITLPSNTDSIRFAIFANTPQQGGILHGVTPVVAEDPEQKPKRDLHRECLCGRDYQIKKILARHLND